jgi:hypothetical protein
VTSSSRRIVIHFRTTIVRTFGAAISRLYGLQPRGVNYLTLEAPGGAAWTAYGDMACEIVNDVIPSLGVWPGGARDLSGCGDVSLFGPRLRRELLTAT